MPFKFNPFTGNFDQTGSGGGGASYIDGEVATYNDLPLSSTTAPLNTAWLVRGSSGVWPFTKPGGVYVRTATGGTSRDADYTYAGIFPDVFSDAQFTIYDDADTSKNLKLQLSGLATGATRTISAPDYDLNLSDPLFKGLNVEGSNAIPPDVVIKSHMWLGTADGQRGFLIDGGGNAFGSDTIVYTGCNEAVTAYKNTLLTSGYFAQLFLATSGNVGIGTTSPSAALDVAGNIVLRDNTGAEKATFDAQGALTANRSYVLPDKSGTLALTSDIASTFAASAITSGVFDNARINFAAPSAIGSTTAAAITGTTGTFSTLNATNGTITASAPVLTLSQTWNNAAVTFTGIRFDVTDTASAAGSMFLDFRLGGTTFFSVGKDSSIFVNTVNSGSAPVIQNGFVTIANNAALRWYTSSAPTTQLWSGGNDTLEQRRAGNAQTLRIYSTIDAGLTNFERLFIRGQSAAAFQIGTEAGGTGVLRPIEFSLGTATASTPLTVSQTWNAGAATFTAFRINATDTASTSGSMLADFQVGGTSRVKITKAGTLDFNVGNFTAMIDLTGAGAPDAYIRNDGSRAMSFSNCFTTHGSAVGLNIRVGRDVPFGWSSSTTPSQGGLDVVLVRDAAETLAQRNGTAAQEKRLYGTFTSSTNYQRMTVKSVKQTLSALSGASATTTGTFIPDGAVVVGVTTRVGTALTGATGYTIGDGTDADRWGDITGTAIGTTSDNRDWTAGTIECFTAGGNITLTAKTSNFTAGAVEICVFYLAGEAD